MPAIRLTQRRVDALRPRRKVRDVRDAELKGYGVRVMPSGARRYFIHSQHRGKRVWKIIGDAAAPVLRVARTPPLLISRCRAGKDCKALGRCTPSRAGPRSGGARRHQQEWHSTLSAQRAEPARPRPPLASHSSNFSVSAMWRVAHHAASVCKAWARFSGAVGRCGLVSSATSVIEDSLAGP